MDMELPDCFDHRGLLPATDYELTIDELVASMLVDGPSPRPIHWNAKWRRKLVLNLAVLANQLWSVGIDSIFIDGSFVEEKSHPNDIDGYFECPLEIFFDIVPRLNQMDPNQCWDWSQGKPKMWDVYRVELFPHYGQLCGIDDATGYELQFPAAFRQSREFEPKGIVKLLKERRTIR